MKGKRILIGISMLMFLSVLAAGLSLAQGPKPEGDVSIQAAVGTAFTYQGRLKRNDEPVNDTCEMAFRLYDQEAAGGSQVGNAITATVPITNGLFTASLDFGGNVFTGDARWLGVVVRCTGDTGFTALSPRQPLTPAPYALALPGLWTQQRG